MYALMPSKIAKRTASGKINKPVSTRVWNHYNFKAMSAEEKFMRNARRRELYARAQKHPVAGAGGPPKKTLEQYG